MSKIPPQQKAELLERHYLQVATAILTSINSNLGLRHNRNFHTQLINTPRVFRIVLEKLNPAQYHKLLKIQTTLQMSAGLKKTQPIRIDFIGTNVSIEIPKPPRFWDEITIPMLERRRAMRKNIPTIGLDLDDRPVRLMIDNRSNVHILISGISGSGKSNVQEAIGYSFAMMPPEDAAMIILDVTKYGEQWRPFANIPHLMAPVAASIPEAEKIISGLRQEIIDRYGQRRTDPPIYVFIDELRQLVTDSKQISDDLGYIASIGRDRNVHLIVATQYPQIKLLAGNSELKRNLGVRLAGRVDNAQSSEIALGMGGMGAETLQGYGDFLLYDGQLARRFTAVHIRNSDLAKIPQGDRIHQLPEIAGPITQGPPAIHYSQQPDELDPRQVALALFNPMGNSALKRELNVGPKKVERIRAFADEMRRWADEQRVRTLPQVHPFLDGTISDQSVIEGEWT